MNHDLFNARRRLLGGAVALSAAVVAVSPALAITAHPDAEILELGRRHAESQRRCSELSDAIDVATDRSAELVGVPAALMKRADDWHRNPRDIGRCLTRSDIERWRTWPTTGLAGDLRTRYLARRAELLTTWDAYLAAVSAADQACGVTPLQAAIDAEDRVLFELEQQIFALRATTPEGWRLKARITAHIIDGQEDGTYEDELVRNLLADLIGPAVVTANGRRENRP